MSLGMTIGGLAAMPPYIVFEKRAVERRRDDGTAFYVDTDFAIVTPHGSKDNVEKVVEEWFARLKEEVRQQRFPQTWLDAYKSAYAAWQSDQAPPVIGTDIRMWPVATPAEIKTLLEMHITSVEVLAQANEETLSRLGMGARLLKQKAIDWLTSKSDSTMVEAMGALRASIANMESRIAALTSRAELAEAQLESARRGAPSPQFVTGAPQIRHDPGPDNTAALIDDAINEALE